MAELGKTALALAVLCSTVAPPVLTQQRDETTVFDSIAVEGADRFGRQGVVSRINIAAANAYIYAGAIRAGGRYNPGDSF